MVNVNTNRSPLGELYDSVIKANGWSIREVAARIEERTAGLGIKKSRIGQLVNAWPLDSQISGEVIRQLALGLGVAPDRVAVAVIQSMGFRVHADSMTPAEAISRDESLSDDTRRSLLAILAAATEGRRGA